MRGIKNHRLFRFTDWCLLVAVFFFGLAACNTNEGKPSASTARTPASPASDTGNARNQSADGSSECNPRCRATCGVDDGCGHKCGCTEDEECNAGVCIDPRCGACRPNERCTDGKCKCEADCAGRDCQDDGCGATCPCPDGAGVNAQGKTVPLAECRDTCQESGFECGVLCGVDCGACGNTDEACTAGACRCAPKCDGTSCSDGCGGSCDCAGETVCNAAARCVDRAACQDTCESTARTCGSICGQDCGACGEGQSCIEGQCREAVSCSDCALQLRLMDRTVLQGKIVRVKVSVDVSAASKDLGPRLMDLRVVADRQVELVDAVAGPALLKTGKDLFVDESTQRPWQRLGDQSYQILAYSLTGTMRVASGRALELTFDLAEPGPVRFALLRRAQTFAPLEVDNILQASAYDEPLAVSR